MGDNVEGSSLVVIDTDAEQVERETRPDARPSSRDYRRWPRISTATARPRSLRRSRMVGTAPGSGSTRVNGTVRATGPIYGPGWRHQLCVAQFAPDGTPKLAVVRKPHVD
ncbi:MAG: hypothetical protein ACI9EZ_001850 [Halobacteriales archaeon]